MEPPKQPKSGVELHANGTPIGSLDILVAGVVREAGGTLVTAGGHFDHVDGLETDTHR